jgi:hypothetical protein
MSQIYYILAEEVWTISFRGWWACRGCGVEVRESVKQVLVALIEQVLASQLGAPAPRR